jgi:heme exporter protein C
MWLVQKTERWDRLASASVEVGVVFTGIGLFTGMVWGQAVWERHGTGKTEADEHCRTFFIYRLLPAPSTTRRRGGRRHPDDRRGQIPLVYFSVNLFRTLHQTQSIRPDGSTMPDEMLVAMLVNVAAFTVVYVALMAARMDLATAEARALPESSMAGDAVRPPRLNEVKDV